MSPKAVRKVAISEAKAKLSEFVDEIRMGHQPVVIQKRDKDAAMLVDVAEYRKLEAIADTVKALELRDALKGRMTPLEKVLAELHLDL
jgi:prevent-host-death family protein